MAALPLQIISNILSRLPVKPLFRFRSVSKPWKSLINSPNFIKLHLSQTLSSGSHTRLVIFHDSLSLSSPNLDLQTRLNFSDLDHPLRHLPAVQLFGSCNGILCLSDYDQTSVFLFNPFTKFRCLLPRFSPSPLSNTSNVVNEPNFLNLVDFGFGYDSLSDDYKVLRMIQTRRNDKVVYREASVYSLKNDSWKCVRDNTKSEMMYANGDTLINETLHFVMGKPVEGRIGCCTYLIQCFNLKDETFSTLGLMRYDNKFTEVGFFMGELRGCLCVMVNYFAPRARNASVNLCGSSKVVRADLWVMKEYGNKESWVKLFGIDKPKKVEGYYHVRPLVYSRDGRRVLLELDGMSFGWYDLEKNKLRRVNDRGRPNPDASFAAWPLVESLVSLDKDKAEAKENTMLGKSRKKKKSRIMIDNLSEEFKLRLLCDQRKEATNLCSIWDDVCLRTLS